MACEGIDQLLQQTRAIGREGAVAHVQCARWGNELIFLLDPDPRYGWVLPAVKKRLREELALLQYDLSSAETQLVYLERGGKLRLLGFELHSVPGSHGGLRVEYQPIEPSARPARPRRQPRWRWDFHPLQWAGRCLGRVSVPGPWHLVPEAYRKAGSVQVGWRHLPIALYPVLALYFGWLSPMALACAAAILLANWRSLPALWLQARRHPLELTGLACGIAFLVCLFVLASDLYAKLPREVPAPHMPPGFYLGEYHPSWDAEPVRYGLYLPPHFQKQKGPFPLIVFLHGHGERQIEKCFRAGVPLAIVREFGEQTPNGPFPFAGFFPNDPDGMWDLDTDRLKAVLKTLDYVSKRHRLDPARVYLTGPSSGGNGVWLWAQAYPDRWAAVVPVAGFIDPDVAKVRHLPVWIFHGGKDSLAPVERERALVQKLKAAGADVRYTEFPNKQHVINRDVYGRKELYDWLASKTRR
jgi:predicted esterase